METEGLFLVFFFLLVDVEIFELVGALRVGNNSEPVTEVVSLKVLLGQIFQISLGEVDVGRNVDLGLSRANVDLKTSITFNLITLGIFGSVS